jgi:hypothetical protein
MIRILLFLLIPLGALSLTLSIRLVRKSFGGKTLLEMPFLQHTAEFTIEKSGTYAIWQKGQYFRKLPVDQFKPEIIRKDSGEKMSLFPSIFRPNSNDGGTVRMEIFRFSASPGKYVLTITEGSSITAPERWLSKLFPVKKTDVSQYFILIRESQPRWLLFTGIFLITLSGLLMIGGLVAGILYSQF